MTRRYLILSFMIVTSIEFSKMNITNPTVNNYDVGDL